MMKRWHLNSVICISLLLFEVALAADAIDQKIISTSAKNDVTPTIVLIEEKEYTEITTSVKNNDTKLPTNKTNGRQQLIEESINHNHVEESTFKQNYIQTESSIPDSLRAGVYLFMGVSGGIIVLIVARIYKLRLHRAERKYGVQGDRSTQELVPLPVSIEDANSEDEDDQTLFEINRQQIRIL